MWNGIECRRMSLLSIIMALRRIFGYYYLAPSGGLVVLMDADSVVVRPFPSGSGMAAVRRSMHLCSHGTFAASGEDQKRLIGGKRSMAVSLSAFWDSMAGDIGRHASVELVKCGLAQKHHRLKPLRLIQPIEDFRLPGRRRGLLNSGRYNPILTKSSFRRLKQLLSLRLEKNPRFEENATLEIENSL